MAVTDNPRDYTWGKRKKNMYWWIGGGALLIAGLIVAGYFVFQSKPDATPKNSNSDSDKQEQGGKARRALDGVEVDAEVSNTFPQAIIIENIDASRPQSGLPFAGIVYEALAEGGIPRFLAIFATHENIQEIGPVRSARPYFVNWAKEYDAVFVHAGGSPQGLSRIKELNVRDFSQFYNSGGFFEKKGRARPHHLYTSSTLLGLSFRDKGYPESGSFRSWKFKDEAKISDRPESQKIMLDFSNFPNQVDYTYDREKNVYARSQGEVESKDGLTGERIAPKNVLVQFVDISNYDELRLNIADVGSGKAILFRDGVAIDGKWIKKTNSDRTIFYDNNDEEFIFNAGQIWVEVLAERNGQNISYQ